VEKSLLQGGKREGKRSGDYAFLWERKGGGTAWSLSPDFSFLQSAPLKEEEKKKKRFRAFARPQEAVISEREEGKNRGNLFSIRKKKSSGSSCKGVCLGQFVGLERGN